VVVGTALGALLVSASALAGAQTGAPALVLLRGLFGARVSFLPTVLNLLQCLGWAVFELVVIAAAAEQLFPGHASMRRPTLATSAGPMSLSPAWTMSHNACKRSVRNREP
jgi:purine-cytosine permease-like protein